MEYCVSVKNKKQRKMEKSSAFAKSIATLYRLLA